MLLPAAAPLSAGAPALLERGVRAVRLSGRGVDRMRRVALTMADLAGAGADGLVEEQHVAEALALRAGREVLDVES